LIEAPNSHPSFIEAEARCIPWPKPGLRRVSINSFGFGGTNSHVVLDDAIHYLQSHGLTGYHHCVDATATTNGVTFSVGNNKDVGKADRSFHQTGTPPMPKLLVWSATDAAALQRMSEAYRRYYRDFMAGHTDKIDQLSYTLAARRTGMAWRTFAVVDPAQDTTNGEAAGNNESLYLDMAHPLRASTEKIANAFIFTGQGAQYAGMGMELLQYPVFQESLKQSDGIMASLGCKWSIFGM
jgi:acyl transferase domain-containing protein